MHRSIQRRWRGGLLVLYKIGIAVGCRGWRRLNAVSRFGKPKLKRAERAEVRDNPMNVP